jgi:superfamily II DNA helicase RecQ
VFQNRTLEALCAARPKNSDELLAIWGLGAERVKKYGADLLKLMATVEAPEPAREASTEAHAQDDAA